mgnify:CR=1 FL=1|tara:strand:- start:1757 stop:1990 length:234 start_codon:yes stop_codon:yes gene_type:complete
MRLRKDYDPDTNTYGTDDDEIANWIRATVCAEIATYSNPNVRFSEMDDAFYSLYGTLFGDDPINDYYEAKEECKYCS